MERVALGAAGGGAELRKVRIGTRAEKVEERKQGKPSITVFRESPIRGDSGILHTIPNKSVVMGKYEGKTMAP